MQKPEAPEWLVEMAIRYHKIEEGEYGCNGIACPGVQRLIALLQRVVSADVPASPTPDGWRPIETAPQDGRWFWALHRSNSSGIYVSAFRWDSSHKAWFAGTGWWPQFVLGFTAWHEMAEQPPAPPAPPEVP